MHTQALINLVELIWASHMGNVCISPHMDYVCAAYAVRTLNPSVRDDESKQLNTRHVCGYISYACLAMHAPRVRISLTTFWHM
jgi:hypothetical protein